MNIWDKKSRLPKTLHTQTELSRKSHALLGLSCSPSSSPPGCCCLQTHEIPGMLELVYMGFFAKSFVCHLYMAILIVSSSSHVGIDVGIGLYGVLCKKFCMSLLDHHFDRIVVQGCWNWCWNWFIWGSLQEVLYVTFTSSFWSYRLLGMLKLVYMGFFARSFVCHFYMTILIISSFRDVEIGLHGILCKKFCMSFLHDHFIVSSSLDNSKDNSKITISFSNLVIFL